MKKRYIVLAIILVLFGFVLVKALNVSYSATDYYYYVRRNMLSHHYIKNNKSNTASGTILIKTDSGSSSTTGESTVVYCAEQGVNNSHDKHTKKILNTVSDSLLSTTAKTKLAAIMPYTYPYVSLSELKNYLKDETIGLSASDYAAYSFDNLDAQESMTAVQAAIWNAIGNTDRFVYGSTVNSISSRQSSFKNFGKINWQNCNGYNTGKDKFATILTNEEKEWFNVNSCDTTGNFYKYVYNVKNDGLSDERINTLIKWFQSLPAKVSVDNTANNFIVKSYNYQLEGDSLTLDVVIDSAEKDYTITFYDYAQKVLLEKTVEGVNGGNKFKITGLPISTVGVNAEVKTAVNDKTVYYYQGAGQDWIGVDDGSKTAIVPLNILNNGTGQVIVYKVSSGAVSVDYTKTIADDSKCGESGCLSGAYFILYASDKKTVIKEFVSSNKSIAITNLPNGTYYLYEQDPPYGYTKPDTVNDFIDKDGYIKIVIENGNTASVIVGNDLTKICFAKVDSTTEKIINGGKFRIEDAEGGTYEVFTSSDQENNHCLTGQLDSGYYYLVEETAPAGYIKTNKIFKFEVGKFDPKDIVVELEESETVIYVENKNGVVTITNDPGVVISKSDLATGACVAGAKLEVKDSTGKTIDSWTSTCEKGKDTHQIALNPGTYSLTETITPSGYATVESISFTIDANGKVDRSLDMKNAPIEVCILKTSEGLEEGLMGAEFEIYKEDGTLYDKFTSDIVATCFPYMPVGTYTIKETKAPEGYKIASEETKITVKDTAETQVFEIENEVDVPKTSLDASKLIVLFATVFMAFGLGLVGYYGYKKQK